MKSVPSILGVEWKDTSNLAPYMKKREGGKRGVLLMPLSPGREEKGAFCLLSAERRLLQERPRRKREKSFSLRGEGGGGGGEYRGDS